MSLNVQIGRRVLVTGATGFVGRHLVSHLKREGFSVRVAVRKEGPGLPGVESVRVGDIGPHTPWESAVRGVDVVFHLAGRAHVLDHRASRDIAAFRRVNVEGMEQLARASAFAGIRRFVLLSSVGIHGGRTDPGDPLTEASPPRPLGAYAFSKREAEDRLRALAVKLKFETVILRPPLVYGPGAPGNFSRLLRWVSAGFPLPFGSVQNRRSFIYVRNLCDALTRAGTDPRAADRVFLVSDGQDLSTPDLIRFLSVFLGKKRCPLFPFPPFLLKGAFLFLGRGELAEKLLDSLEVNSGLIQTTLDWRPPWNVEDGLRDACAEWLDGTGSEMLS